MEIGGPVINSGKAARITGDAPQGRPKLRARADQALSSSPSGAAGRTRCARISATAIRRA